MLSVAFCVYMYTVYDLFAPELRTTILPIGDALPPILLQSRSKCACIHSSSMSAAQVVFIFWEFPI